MIKKHLSRLASLQHIIPESTAYLLANRHDLAYFTGFQTLVPEEREAFLFISHQSVHFIHSSFIPLPQLPIIFHERCRPPQLSYHLKKIKQELSLTNLEIDAGDIHVDEYLDIQTSGFQVLNLDRQSIWKLRNQKDEREIELIQKSCQIALDSWNEIQPQIVPGITELELKEKLDRKMQENGSQRPAFPTIVAFGQHSANPHHQPTDTVLTPETAILVDFGATFGGYRSDMTRTFWFGQHMPELFKEIKSVVEDAYQQSLELLINSLDAKTSFLAQQMDLKARQVIDAAGFGSNFIHTSGHGIGLEIHEPPSIHHLNQQQIQAGMVITLEPGIYINDQFGFRYENTLLVLPDKVLELTKDATS